MSRRIIQPTVLPQAAAFGEESIATLAASYQLLLRRFSLPLLAGLLLLTFTLLLNHPDRLGIFLVALLPATWVLAASVRQQLGGLPVFSLYVLVQALSFVSPLFGAEIVADHRVLITASLLGSCLLPLLLWFGALVLGWSATPSSWLRRRPAPPLSQSLRNPGTLPHWSLAVAAAVQLLITSPLFWKLSGTLSQGLLTPLRTLVVLASITGAFTGAYAWARGFLARSWLWLALMMVPLASALSSLLLSSLQILLFAALLGLWLGRARQALPITLAILLLVAWLNTGKAAIRQVYWSGSGPGARVPSTIVLLQEWSAASYRAFTQPSTGERPTNLFTDRLNNLQNLLYVQQQLASGTSTLAGESLKVIPQVLVPRILNSEKVRSQEGQVLLNLHFGRQRNVKDTEKAYIAWGFLAEGVGNFGSTAGPLLMGVATGCLLRLTENLGRGQLILSTPGLLSLALTLFWLTTYEMAASTFAAAALQIIVVVLFVGWWFGRRLPSAIRPA